MRAKDRPLANDFVTDDEFDRLLESLVRQHRSRLGTWSELLYLGRVCQYRELSARCWHRIGLYFSQAIIWDKMHPVMTRKDFMGAHEWAFYGWKEGAGHKFFGPNNATDLWHVKKIPPQQLEHLTGKPAELAVRAMQYSSRKGDNVLDLFGGSGSTLDRCRTDRPASVLDGARPAVLRRHCRPLPAFHRQEGGSRTDRRVTDPRRCSRGEHAVIATAFCATRRTRRCHVC